jgi:ADP-ribosylation factor 1/2
MGNNLSISLLPLGWQNSIPCFRKARKQYKFMIHGLDCSGKTTLLYRLKLGDSEIVTTTPTIGFNVETLEFQGREFVAWDVGGRDKMRPLWRHYYPGTDAVLFMVDSNDIERMEQAKDEFHRMLKEELLQKRPFLVFCNKQDLPSAWSPEKISTFFGVEGTLARVNVLGCITTEGVGLMEGLQWLVETIETEADEEDDLTSIENDVSSIIAPEKHELSYDPTTEGSNVTLQRFLPIQMGTRCPFAKAAKLWGGRIKMGNDDVSTLARSNAQALTEFVEWINSSDQHKGEPLDGFCIELEDPRAQWSDPEALGEALKETLTAIADLDPAQEQIMRVNYIGSRGWRFRFARMDFFVTTFAPCYSQSSSRFAYGTGRAFVLLQPETSFARHRLPADTPHTEWEAPKTIRDKTRVAFRQAGQSYFIPDTTTYPAAEHIVKPLKDDGVAVVRWWLDTSSSGASGGKARI